MRFLNFQREPKDKLPVNLLETVMVSSGTHLVQVLDTNASPLAQD